MKSLITAIACTLFLISFGARAELVSVIQEASGQADAEATITISEVPGDPWAVDISIEVPEIPSVFVADIRGFFFNFPIEAALPGVVITGPDVTYWDTKIAPETDFTGFSGDVNLNGGGGLEGFPELFNVGVEIGNPGLRGGRDDIQQTTFRFSIGQAYQQYVPGGSISPAIFEGSPLALRVTSLGEDREGSSKLMCFGDCFTETEIPAPAPLLLVAAGMFALRRRFRRA